MFGRLLSLGLIWRWAGGLHGLGLILCTASIALAAPMAVQSVPASAGKTGGLTVRVDAGSGAPRLVVNGRPVRARMFFGGPGSAPIKIEPAAAPSSSSSSPRTMRQHTGTLHFRFGQTPGDVFLDNIRIVDMASGKDVTPVSDFESGPDAFSRDWTFWPPGPANTVGTVTVEPSVGASGTAGLHVKLRGQPDGEWPDWHIYHLPNLAIVRRQALPRDLLGPGGTGARPDRGSLSARRSLRLPGRSARPVRGADQDGGGGRRGLRQLPD